MLRALVPSRAGTGGLPYRRVVAFNLAGGTIWGVTVTGAGYLAGTAYGRAERSLGLVGMLTALLLILAAVVTNRWLSRRAVTR